MVHHIKDHPFCVEDDVSAGPAGQMYVYRVSSRNAALNEFGAASEHITAYAALVPSEVLNLAVADASWTTVSIRWDEPTTDGGSLVRKYIIEIDDGYAGQFRYATSVTAPFATVRELHTGRAYRLRVCAENDVGKGAFAPFITQVVAARPSGLLPVATSSAGKRSFRVSWAEPTSDGGSFILGYQVLFGETCEKYDGTNDATVMTRVVSCTPGYTYEVSVRARNTVGWSEPSASVRRVCAVESTAPLNFRLALNSAVAMTPLDMSDQRSPTSMKVAWDPPADLGGSPIVAYRLYRDDGFASGNYVFAYQGIAPEFENVGLVNGRTYRFYATAINGVGESAQSPILAVEMKCSPRVIRSEPLVQPSKNAITIIWPTVTSDCGGSVTGYRIYRNGELVYPISNSFTDITIKEGATVDKVVVSFAAVDVGKAWVMVSKRTDLQVKEVKAGVTASGATTCQYEGAVAAGGNDVSVHGCRLDSATPYTWYVYLEDSLGLDDDGLLKALSWTSPEASNAFVSDPVVSAITKDGVAMAVTATRTNGQIWGILTTTADALLVEISSVKALQYALPGAGCSFADVFCNDREFTFTFSGCALTGNTRYALFVYIENRDLSSNMGTLSAPVDVQVPASNTFPEVVWRASPGATMQLRITPTATGVFWSAIFPSTATVTIADVKAGTAPAVCAATGAVTAATPQDIAMTCTLTTGDPYRVYVYAEDALGGNDGSFGSCYTDKEYTESVMTYDGVLSAEGCQRRCSEDMGCYYFVYYAMGTKDRSGLDVGEKCAFVKTLAPILREGMVSGALSGPKECALYSEITLGVTSNTFAVVPQVSAVTVDGATVGFTPSLTGVGWALVVAKDFADCISAKYMKEGAEAQCKVENVAITANTVSTINFAGCNLLYGHSYTAFVYVEGPTLLNTLNDGLVSNVLAVEVPPMQYAVQPALSTIPTTDGVELKFTSSVAGIAWAMVVPWSNVDAIDARGVKAGTYSLGAATCRKTAQAITTAEVTFTFTACSLSRGASFAVMVYYEDSRAKDDGALAWPLRVDVPATSATFATLPVALGSATTAGISVKYTLSSHVVTAKVWALVSSESARTIAEIKSATGALGRAACKFADVGTTVGSEITLAFTDCDLGYGTQYYVYVYADDGTLRDDGWIAIFPFVTLAGVSNTFTVLPTVTVNQRDSTTFSFETPSAGTYWVLLQSQGTVATKAEVRAGGACAATGNTVANSAVVPVLACAIPNTAYDAFIYVTNAYGHLDGTLTQVAYTSAYSNRLDSFSVPTMPTSSGLVVRVDPAFSGKLWTTVTFQAHKPLIVDPTKIVDLTHALCQQSDVALDGNLLDVTLSACSFVNTQTQYTLFVYVEDANGNRDGETTTYDFTYPPCADWQENCFDANLALLSTSLTDAGYKFTPGTTGKSWAAINLGNAATAAISDIKTGFPCTSGEVAVQWITETSPTLACVMAASTEYTLYVYLEKDNTGTGVQQSVTFTTPVSRRLTWTANETDVVGRRLAISSEFTLGPTRTSTMLPTGGSFTFTPSVAGKAYVAIVDPTDAGAMTIDMVMAGTAPQIICTQFDAVTAAAYTLNIASCELAHNKVYTVLVYINDVGDANDGTLSSLSGTVHDGSSNGFAVFPAVSSITADGASFGITPTENGRAWVVVAEKNVFTPTPAAMRAGGQKCSIEDNSITANAAVSIALTACNLQVGVEYEGFVYVANAVGGDDGKIASLPFMVTPSNTFALNPSLVVPPQSSFVQFQFATSADGTLFAIVSTSPTESVSNIMTGGGATVAGCRNANGNAGEAITAGRRLTAQPWRRRLASSATPFTVTCTLASSVSYYLITYVHGAGVTEGTTFSLPFSVPVSNSFRQSPAVNTQASSDGVTLSFIPASAGKMWVLVVHELNAPAITTADMKTPPVSAQGSGTCRVTGVGEAISTALTIVALTGCTYTRGQSYRAFVYIEDASGLNDGSMSAPVVVEVPPSNDFVVAPFLTSSPHSGGLTFAFTAQSIDGRAFVGVYPTAQVPTTAVLAESRTNAINVAACQYVEHAVGTLGVELALSNCGLLLATAYTAVIYVEEQNTGVSDGSWASIPFTLASVTNRFATNPVLTTVADIVVAFTAVALQGFMWMVVVEEGTVMDIASIKLGTASLGAEECKFSETPISNGALSFTLKNCDLITGNPYVVYTYIGTSVDDVAGTFHGAPLNLPVVVVPVDLKIFYGLV